jgi:hypothetical protein
LVPHCPAGSSIHKLEFTIRKVSLDDKPNYWALSYVWGDPDDTEPICIEGQTFMVTRNLREALKRVRNLGTTETLDWFLWIDSVCIKQQDLDEKCWQVSIMARIYSEAYAVYVWLGLGDHNTSLAMDLMRTLGSDKFGELNPLTDDHFVSVCGDVINRSSRKGYHSGQDIMIAIENIFHHRQYWKRAWTFQEFCLIGKHTGVICCGDSWIPVMSAWTFAMRSRVIGQKALLAGPGFCKAKPIVTKFLEYLADSTLIPLDKLLGVTMLRFNLGFSADWSEKRN